MRPRVSLTVSLGLPKPQSEFFGFSPILTRRRMATGNDSSEDRHSNHVRMPCRSERFIPEFPSVTNPRQAAPNAPRRGRGELYVRLIIPLLG